MSEAATVDELPKAGLREIAARVTGDELLQAKGDPAPVIRRQLRTALYQSLALLLGDGRAYVVQEAPIVAREVPAALIVPGQPEGPPAHYVFKLLAVAALQFAPSARVGELTIEDPGHGSGDERIARLFTAEGHVRTRWKRVILQREGGELVLWERVE